MTQSSPAFTSTGLDDSQQMLLKLYDKSILKKAKFSAVESYLPDVKDKTCLDIGADNGVLSHLLRAKGGNWYSADLDEHVVSSIRQMVGSNVLQIDGGKTHFSENTFDLVVIIDFLEHIHTDNEFVEELYRIMKPSTTLIINVPHYRPGAWIRKLRLAIGLTDEKHGHVRPGYTLESLSTLLGQQFSIVEHKTYSKFFVELYDALISYLFEKMQKHGDSAKGTVVTAQDLAANRKKFKLFSLIYPFVFVLSKLDKLLFFTPGYSLIVKAVKN